MPGPGAHLLYALSGGAALSRVAGPDRRFGPHHCAVYAANAFLGPDLGSFAEWLCSFLPSASAAGDLAMAAVQKFDNLVDMEVERRRLKFSLTDLMVSAENAEVGLGDLKDDRLAAAIALVVEGYELPRAPAPSEVFIAGMMRASGRSADSVVDMVRPLNVQPGF